MKVIEVSNLRKQYRDRLAVDDVSFSVEEGEIFGVLGPNGAGKTTTVECVAGLRAPDSGTVSVLGGLTGTALKECLGVQLQSSALPEKIKVWEALDLYASFYRAPADRTALLERVGLADKRDAHYGRLSGGQQQRLSIALALIGGPRVAILDELTTGLDPQARRDTWELIERVREDGVTILLVTHFMEEAERLCDRLALIDSGRVVAVDSPEGLIARIGSRQTVRFRPTRPVDDAVFGDLPEVTEVRRSGGQLAVTGTGDLLLAVTVALATAGVTPADLRVERPSLDDAFLALTGKKISS
ncbi:ABC-2 type transport system ATP-binding protein [Streptosporangium becharense]|uniref:ABC-2 type transport system ATP-binding protein n=1 Tax=Streptosporangium becharense TaxID=1816182 RepID=A0A7W9MHE4_9ACTN|nr:ABC transporter ATP-binding protein [Streptosporangium becharense]MBB2912690.1 ABC-2 type transport system ATP-binding protein [Streptosporangium becharense]MBB5820481.1 ABC-2 type transport system ATP-binding protein [Streptosporangium becharense]